MMNKPAGVVSATEDRQFKTVIDIIPEDMKRKGLFRRDAHRQRRRGNVNDL